MGWICLSSLTFFCTCLGASFTFTRVTLTNLIMLPPKKKSIVSLRYTILTLICYSHTCTPGWARGSDPNASGMGYYPRPWEELHYPPTFRELQQINMLSTFQFAGILLPVPIKLVIGDCSPSSRTLLLRTQMPVSQADIITWDIFLWSLLSCLVE